MIVGQMVVGHMIVGQMIVGQRTLNCDFDWVKVFLIRLLIIINISIVNHCIVGPLIVGQMIVGQMIVGQMIVEQIIVIWLLVNWQWAVILTASKLFRNANGVWKAQGNCCSSLFILQFSTESCYGKLPNEIAVKLRTCRFNVSFKVCIWQND
jgi:hypothetical protein